MKIKSAFTQGDAHTIAGTKGFFVFSLLVQLQATIYLFMRFFYDVEVRRFIHDIDPEIEWNGWVSDVLIFGVCGIFPLHQIFVIRGLITGSSGCSHKAD
ncbi:MAG: hypothetical protein FD130_1675 [Halothiobacillaceae bacterium]|nr:MAG: hypothetical protein FD130_1675 [Halothiobacillaceae bacterium]